MPVVIRPEPTEEELAAWRATPWWERHRLRWCWRLSDPSWHVAFCYLLGSVGFAAGGLASCLRRIVDTPRYYLYLEVAPYVVGGLNFLIATLLLVYTSYEARYGEPGRADRRRVARKHTFLGAEVGFTIAGYGLRGTPGGSGKKQKKIKLHSCTAGRRALLYSWWTDMCRAAVLLLNCVHSCVLSSIHRAADPLTTTRTLPSSEYTQHVAPAC